MDPINSDGHIDTDVIIVGAGPIGFTTACALAHHGVRFRIIEKAHGISGASKGHDVIARAQELLASVGVLDAIAAKSYRAPFTQFMLDQVPLVRLVSRDSESQNDAVLFSNQGVIEQDLTDLLTDRGLDVEYGTEVVEVRRDDDRVSIDVVTVVGDGNRTGTVSTLVCRYLVGADGAAGTVRKAIGLDYDVQEFEDRALRQMDGKLRWRRSIEPDTARFFLFPHGFAGVLPVWEGNHRLFFLEDSDTMPNREPTRDEMVARAREVTGDPTFDLTDPTWASYGEFRHGVSPAYAKGRVFLAGDAGHLTLPIGGQGMNAGFLDAIGIAWRLAMTLAGDGGSAILDSYDPERHDAHASLGKQQVRGFEQLMRRNALADDLIGKIAGVAPGIGSYVFGGSDLEQLTVAYPDSPISEDHFSKLNPNRIGAVRAGDRIPDAVMATACGHPITLFDLVYNPDGQTWGWRLLLLDGGDRQARPKLQAAADGVRAFGWIRPVVVIADPGADNDADNIRAVFDLDCAAHDVLGLKGQPAILLVRPDGHIAFRCSANSENELRRYIDGIVPPH